MHFIRSNVIAAFVLSFELAIVCAISANTAKAGGAAAGGLAFDVKKRVPWSTSRVIGSPDAPAPYRTAPTYSHLKFFEPLAICTAPGTDRLLLAERPGKIYAFDRDRNAARADLVLDVGRMVYGVAAHPKFSDNGYFYLTCIVPANAGSPAHSRLSRYVASREMPWRADPKSELVVLEWPTGGHNGGHIVFGPDGLLYLVCGDGSGIADEFQTGQDLGDVLASLLRIDVDRPDAGRNYGVPKDNPFVNLAGAKPEIWAYGLRQLWKFSFDRKSGELWGGEVGQDLWESIYKIEKGGNYGWSVREGTHDFRPDRKLGPTPILKPILELPHSDYRSLTGGFVYRGSRYPDLVGMYVYGDYDTGKVAALRYDGQKVTEQRELVDTPLRIVAFGEDQAGELLLIDYMGGVLHELVPASLQERTADFPRKLSETGLFASTKDHIPAAGVIPYSVNADLWSDHAEKERFLALPGDGLIEFETVTYPQPAPGAPAGWRFPHGTVTVKTFSIELEKGNPATRRRLETRIMHFEQLAGNEDVGDQVWRGYVYIWNDDQTDAELLDAAGLDRELTIRDASAPGGMRKQTWHFPSRTECTLCHTLPAKYALGVNTLQLNRDHDYGNGVVANQLRVLADLGIFKQPPAKPADELPRLANYRDEKLTLDARARAYLHANCAHCHMKWGGGNADFQLLATLPLNELGIVGTRPGHGFFELSDPRDVAPGEPQRSMIFHRMTKLGLGRMPHVASNVVDEQGVKLVKEWIASLPRTMLSVDMPTTARCLQVLREGLQDGLKGDDFWPAMHAAEGLTLAGHGQEVLDALRPRLDTERDDQKRCGLARELVRAGDRSYTKTLFEVLASPDTHGHAHAAESLYKVREIGDGTALRRSFDSAQPTALRQFAAGALAQAGDAQALAFIRKTLLDTDAVVSQRAAWLLSIVGDRSDIPAVRKRAAAVPQPAGYDNTLATLGDEQGLAALERNLGDPDPAVRAGAATFAGEAGATRTSEKLKALLDDPNLDARIRAAQSLLWLAQPVVRVR